ncbi:MAG: CBS domain-containing protein [Thaumarchaeota archaeon]|nr:CBS domain-containing protein [Nitrososphaerota archaeon]MDG6995098.1 CBS domain-containing protein [Nitrososphaerota archaeon]
MSSATMRVLDVMSTDVVKAQLLEPVYDAVYRMLTKNVGSIVITDNGMVVGIVTKGDVLRRAFLKGVDPKSLPVKKVMSTPPVTISPAATLEEASKLMNEKRISKLPVVENGKLVGIITSTDIIKAEPIQVGYLQELVKARFVPHDLA